LTTFLNNAKSIFTPEPAKASSARTFQKLIPRTFQNRISKAHSKNIATLAHKKTDLIKKLFCVFLLTKCCNVLAIRF
jgi:hypothetical protein